jgi:HEAT repeat protein
LLKDKDRPTRVAAAETLWKMREKKTATAALTELLKDQDGDVRSAAASALGRIGPEVKDTVPALMELLKDQWHVEGIFCPREAAAWALGNMGPEAKIAVPAITELLRDREASVRCTAASTLEEIGPEAKTAVPILTELLKDPKVRDAAASTLGKIGPEAKSAVPALAELLAGKGWPLPAIRALWQIGPDAKAAVPSLAELLRGKDPVLKRDVALTLRRIGPGAKAAVPALVGLLKDRNIAEEAAVWTLGGIGPEAKAAIPALTALLKSEEDYNEIPQAAAWALAKIGIATLPTLTGLLKDKDQRVRWLAAWAVGEIGPESKAAVSALIELLKAKDASSLRLCVVQTLGKIGPEAKTAVPALRELLSDHEVLVRRAAVSALIGIDPEAKAAVAELLNDESAEVRDVAATSLGRASLEKTTEADIKGIRGLIADLARIDSPDYGFSSTMAGNAFAPIPSSGHFGLVLLIDHGLKRNLAFTSLVELGPKALPFLLESLDDQTPIKLATENFCCGGSIFRGHEIEANAFNRHEATALANVDTEESFRATRSLGEYTTKVGDICFVLIGQITNRSYNAVRYQPTFCIVVNSTVQDKQLAAEVRAIWGKSDYRQKLLDSLLVDLHTRGKFQVGAAMRLAYYFPEASEDLLVARLKGLEIATADLGEQVRHAGVGTEDFVKAVSFSSRPGIRAQLLEIFRKTSDPAVLVAALPGVGKEHGELAFRSITEQLNGLPKEKSGPYCEGYQLLVALGDRFPERAEGVFQSYLKPGTVQRCWTVVLALRETCGHLAIRLLTPLLEDKRETGEEYNVNPNENQSCLPIRMCDEAAATIAMHSKALKFVMEGSHNHLDEEIKAMRRMIAEMKSSK